MMEPREGYEIVTLGAVCLPRKGDIAVIAGLDAEYCPVDLCFEYSGGTVAWDSGWKVYRPIIKDAKDEEIEFLRRVADQAVDATALRILRSAGGVCNEIEMCGEYYKAASDVPDLYKYLLDREKPQ